MLEPYVIRAMEHVDGWTKLCLRRGLKVFLREVDLKNLDVLIRNSQRGTIMVALSCVGELVESVFDATNNTWSIAGHEDITFCDDAKSALGCETTEIITRKERRARICTASLRIPIVAMVLIMCTGLRSPSRADVNQNQIYASPSVVATQVAAEAKRFAKNHPADVTQIIATTKSRKTLLQKLAARIGVKPSLITAVAAQESRGNEQGSLRGRYFGPMQVNRSYIRTRKLPMKTVADGYRAGADYFQRECLAQFGGHQLFALAAYNGGYPSIKRAVRWSSLPSRGSDSRSLTAIRQLAIRRSKQYRYAIVVMAKATIIDKYHVFQAGE